MEVTFNVPTDLSEIKLSDYQRFIKIAEGKEEDVFIRQKMVQIFCNVPLLAVNNMQRKDFKEVSNSLISALQQKPKLTPTFTLKGKEYGFIPNLDALTTGEYIDLDKYIQDNENIHKAMAVLFRPITNKKKDKYLIEDYEGSDKYSEILKDMPMNVARGATLFFWTIGIQLLKITPKFLERKVAKNKKVQSDLEKNGVGISTYISSLQEMCLKLEMSLRFPLARL
ncbi:hypothetical protein [Flagellimonas sp. CMM7]|uniref:hypothetical protein n=1 Tax=Flagellimonas sp. CMM7 TaxID=2654676 RepID=UPI0013D68F5D|nr:hypothetical protein [Flagellimonas sp. CMM7]UII80010.1 hypothetical protein LV704_00465 [Flagellimonas sp. CMM7]